MAVERMRGLHVVLEGPLDDVLVEVPRVVAG